MMGWTLKGCTFTSFLIFLTMSCFVRGAVEFPQCEINSEVTHRPRGYDRISNKGLIALYDTAFFFVDDIIHNSDLRYMQDRGVDFADPDSISKSFEENWETWLEYWVGYMVMASIGVFLILSMTIGGFVTCCCRCCCGNCGSTKRPEKDRDKSLRICCGISLLIIMILCMFGGICIIITSLDLMKKIDARNSDSVYNNYAEAFEELDDYFESSVNEINCTSLGSFRATKDDVFRVLDSVANDSVQHIDDRIAATETLQTLSVFTSQLTDLSDHLSESEGETFTLQTSRSMLDSQLSTAISSAVSELQNCKIAKAECSNMIDLLNSLNINVDYPFDFTGGSGATDALITADVDQQVNMGLQTMGNTKYNVATEMEPEITVAKDQTENIDREIVSFMMEINNTLLGADLQGISQSLRDLEDDIPGWIWDLVAASLISAGSIVIFIAVLTYMGLIQGIACSLPDTEDDNCATTIQAANWLKAAVAFIFIFYWIFMIACSAIFVAGGIAHNDACRHAVKVNDSAITSIIDDVVSQYIEDIGATASQIYTSCGNNEALYTAVQADKMPGLNITEMLDLTELRKVINDIKDIDIDIGAVELLNDEAATALQVSDAEFVSFLTDIAGYNTELEKDILSEDVDPIISELRLLNDRTGVNLDQAILEFDQVSATVGSMKTSADELKSHFSDITNILNSAALSDSVEKILEGEVYLNDEGNADIKQYIGNTADGVYDDFNSMTNYIDRSIRRNVSHCFPAYDSLLILIDSTCVDVAYPANGLWLSFGYTLILYIPAIFIMLKLINLYRVHTGLASERSDVGFEDGFEDDYAKKIMETNTQNYDMSGNSTEMTAINNPMFISDEGLRNGFGNSPTYNGAHVYPGYGTHQSVNNQGSLPGVRYASLHAQVNHGYRAQEEIQTTRFRENDNLSYTDQDYPNSQNLKNDHLTLAYFDGRQKENQDEQKDKRNSVMRLGEDDHLYSGNQNYPYSQNRKNDHLTPAYAHQRQKENQNEQKDKRNSAMRFGVQVFPTPANPSKYDEEWPYHLPRPRKITQI